MIHCVADGLTNREIAAALVIAPGTVRTHLEQVYEKLAVGSTTAALARQCGVTPLDGVARQPLKRATRPMDKLQSPL